MTKKAPPPPPMSPINCPKGTRNPFALTPTIEEFIQLQQDVLELRRRLYHTERQLNALKARKRVKGETK